MAKTISFDEKNNRWSSFWTYYPECMARMNRGFFTFKNGQLFKHHSETAPRNRFYDEDANYLNSSSSVTFVFNQNPNDVKTFKTLNLESNSGNWSAELTTNIDSGHINSTSFVNNENEFYAYIRRNGSGLLNTDLLSVQGVGNLVSSTGNTYTFATTPSFISTEDTLCYYNGTNLVVIEKIVSFTSTKNPVAESFGLKGNYAIVKMTTGSQARETLFTVNSQVSKSNI
jgi:hypothetical protein